MDQRTKKIQQASIITLIGNGLLAGGKIVTGFIAGSFAVIGDGIDSSTDVVISIITLITSVIAMKPPDLEHPFGHKRAETIATKALSFIILFAGFQLALASIQKFFSLENLEIPSKGAIIVTIISIIGKLIMAGINYRIGKKIKSEMILANAKNMRNDILISVSVLTGLILTLLLKMPILDIILALAVSLWVIRSGFGIFMETSMELMDGIKDSGIYKQIFSVIKEIKGASNPHRVRVRKLSNLLTVELDLECDPEMKVIDAHKLTVRVEKELREKIESIYDVMIHIEPVGNQEIDEKFGISEQSIQ